MRLSSILSCLLIVVMMSGCGQVVYRVNPDSPAKMGIQEARDALELSLSLIQKPPGIETITLQGDELVIFNPRGSSHITHHTQSASYDDISQKVWKYGKNFMVDVNTSSVQIRTTQALNWKSEEDARSFVDAAHALRQAKYRKDPDKTEIAMLPTAAPKTGVPRQPPESPLVVTEEKIPPQIMIVSPDVTRAVSLVARKSSITVIGIVESKIGISDILINGQQVDLDEKGNFSGDVLLRVGKNNITVTAIDIRKNKVTKQFVINREAGKVAAVKKEEPVPEKGFTSGKYHALLIAVQDYSNPEIGKLDYPVSDARQLMEVLSSRYNFEKENIRILNNPDRKKIYKTLQDLRKQLTDQDNLLIFYAGHGMWLDDMKQGFWLPMDAAGLNDPSDWIPNSSIRDYIKAIKAKHILLVADACFSGGIFKLREASGSPGASVEKIYETPSRKAMTSGSLKTVPDQSVFVEFLIKRLKENNEPYLDSQKLFTRLREAVINNSKVNQTPLYGAINEAGDEGGDFVFVRRQ
ncbi:MAG: caspase family protein [Deltaproteobacteria bacterium]